MGDPEKFLWTLVVLLYEFEYSGAVESATLCEEIFAFWDALRFHDLFAHFLTLFREKIQIPDREGVDQS
jgi:hypothetical protein